MICTNHPEVVVGVAPCSLCRAPFCRDCMVEHEGRPVCAPCRTRATAVAAAEPEPDVPPPRKPYVPDEQVPPWEKRAEHGWWAALWKTAFDVIRDPTGFFRRLDTSVERYDVLFLYPAFATVIAGISALMQMAGLGALAALGQQQSGAGGGGGLAPMLVMQGAGGCIGVAFAPFGAAIEMLIWAGAMHLGLLAQKAIKRSFGQTLRGCGYAYLPYCVMGLLPILGQIVGFIWTIVAQVIMLREVHGTTTGKAVVAVLWPAVLCCCLSSAAATVVMILAAQNR